MKAYAERPTLVVIQRANIVAPPNLAPKLLQSMVVFVFVAQSKRFAHFTRSLETERLFTFFIEEEFYLFYFRE